MTRIPFGSVGFALAAALFAAGCGDSTGPDGAPTDLTVRVYVDADGSGTFTAGDLPVSGATVTATRDDGTTATATSDAQGVAEFPALPAGTYTLSTTATPPAGAVLATARTPLFTATALGGTATAEFRFSYFPGSLTGVLYRDENGNNAFDADADLAAPGIPVELFAGTSASGTPISTTSTTAAGEFQFNGLRPGTYTVRFGVPAGVNVVGGAAQTVTVAPTGTTVLRARFTGNLRIPIAQARMRAANSVVTVEGVVTAGRGQLQARNFYLQDATGGIQVFLPSGSTAQAALGDSVRVTGPIGAFNGEVQIQTTASGPVIVENLGTGTVPAPRSIDGPQVMAFTYEGQLVRVDSLEVISIQTFGTPVTSANVEVQTPQGNRFVVRLDNAGNVPPTTFEVGRVYTVTGVMGVRNGVPQLKPRSTDDVQRTSAPTVADARAQAQGSPVTVIGVVTVGQGTFRTDNIYLQDPTGGIQVFGVPTGAGIAVGDSVQVSGTLGQFEGELQVVNPTVSTLGTGTVPAPRVITGAQLAGNAFEGQLARIEDVVVTSVGGGTSSTFNVTGRAPDGTTVTIRVEGRTGLTRGSFTVGSTYDVVGVLSSFRGTGQIKPRGAADVTAG